MADVPRWFAELLQEELQGTVELSADQIAKLHSHYELLAKWSQKINLTSVRIPEEIVVRHYCESLFFASHLPAVPGASILDIGSGAGFPGFPMAVLRPDWQVTLLEAHQRKAVFLREGARGFSNVAVASNRAETMAGSFGWIVSRAVRPEEVLQQVPRLGKNVALLIGEVDLPVLLERSDISWSETLHVPWGNHRICIFGRGSV